MLLPRGESGQLALVGCYCCHTEVAAQTVRCLKDSDVMPLLGSDDGSLCACDAAACDPNGLLFRDGRQIVVQFAAHTRIDHTLCRQATPQAGDTALEAGGAADDALEVALLDLVGHQGICQRGTSHVNSVHLAAGDDGLSVHGVVDTADYGDRDIDHLLHSSSIIQQPAMAECSGLHLGVTGGIHAGGDVDGVDPRFFHQTGNGHGVHDGQTFGDPLGARQLDVHTKVIPHLAADIGDDLQQEADAVGKAAAVFVGALVGIAGQELADEVPMGSVDHHAIKARLLGTQGGVAEVGDQGLDLFHSQLMGDLPLHRTFDGRGRFRLAADDGGGGLTASVVDLGIDLGAILVDTTGQLFEPFDLLVLPQARDTIIALALGGDCKVFGDDQTPAALGFLFVVGDETVGTHAILGTEIHNHGGDDETVLDLHRAELDGGKQILKNRCFHVVLSFFLKDYLSNCH